MQSVGPRSWGASVRHEEGSTQAPADGDVQPSGLAVASALGSMLPSRVQMQTLTAAGLSHSRGPTQVLLCCASKGIFNALLLYTHCSQLPMMASCCDLHSIPKQLTQAKTPTCLPVSCQHEYSYTKLLPVESRHTHEPTCMQQSYCLQRPTGAHAPRRQGSHVGAYSCMDTSALVT